MNADGFHKLVGRGVARKCWPWLGCRGSGGYGELRFDGVKTRAHRVAYALANGGIPAGLHVCHRCDNRICCNPAHLFAGTLQDNVSDMVRKGRQASGPACGNSGSRNGRAKLSECEALQIRAMAARVSHKEIARRYGLSQPTVSDIIRRKSWRHI